MTTVSGEFNAIKASIMKLFPKLVSAYRKICTPHKLSKNHRLFAMQGGATVTDINFEGRVDIPLLP